MQRETGAGGRDGATVALCLCDRSAILPEGAGGGGRAGRWLSEILVARPPLAGAPPHQISITITRDGPQQRIDIDRLVQHADRIDAGGGPDYQIPLLILAIAALVRAKL